MAFYLMSMAAYAVLRLPYICRTIMGLQARREQIRLQRMELEAMIRERREQRQKLGVPGDGDVSRNDPPRRLPQFTVRTFFVAAFLISLFAAAAKLLDDPARFVALFSCRPDVR